MKCPVCRSAETWTKQTADHGQFVMRLQRCKACECRWSTREIVVDGSLEYSENAAGEYGPFWRTIRNEILKRDIECKGCGTDRSLEVHHRVPLRLFRRHEQANELSNLILLCSSCHRNAERHYYTTKTVLW